jgi:hypothetical protein
VVISKLEWVGDGKSLSDLYKDFWCLYGHFAEREQFISTVLSKDSVTFIIICGNSQNNPHGHLLRIQVVGSSVKKSIEKIHVANAEQSVKSK